MTCLLCGRRPEGAYVVIYEELCDRHQWEMVTFVTEDYRRHPYGRCTTTCGCFTLAELRR
jgi:hypothetical protein